jgi:bifunctional non-homologous end joining protein LigD
VSDDVERVLGVEVKRPAKELFPGITKLDVAEYFAAVGDDMVRHLRDRPLNLDRYPDGIGGRKLFTQAIPGHFPESLVGRVTVPKRDGTVTHAMVDRPEALVYLAGQAVIALHAWTSRRDRLDRPDRLIIDFDPQVDDFAAIRSAAIQAGDLYRECGLEPFAMVTGSRGIHVVAPLRRTSDHARVAEVARAMARVLVERDPEGLTTEFSIAKRGDRTYVDVGRVRWGHTAVSPYSIRPKVQAPVATPLRWEELGGDALRPDGFTIRDVPKRLRTGGEPWADIAEHARGLGGARRFLRLSGR